MILADSFFDRHTFSTDTNEYATGLNDENEWEENILDSEIPIDQRIDDYLDDPDSGEYIYNETGYDPGRVT